MTTARMVPIVARTMQPCTFCPVCGDVIGVYEPLAVVRGESVRRTSLAMEPSLASGEEVITHASCQLGPVERSWTPQVAASAR